MEKLYLIEFNALHYREGDEEPYREVNAALGVFDTARRAICYLRRFLTEKDEYGVVYYGHRLFLEEDLDGPIKAKAKRRYKYPSEEIREEMTMKIITINDLCSPSEEIQSLYC